MLLQEPPLRQGTPATKWPALGPKQSATCWSPVHICFDESCDAVAGAIVAARHTSDKVACHGERAIGHLLVIHTPSGPSDIKVNGAVVQQALQVRLQAALIDGVDRIGHLLVTDYAPGHC